MEIEIQPFSNKFERSDFYFHRVLNSLHKINNKKMESFEKIINCFNSIL